VPLRATSTRTGSPTTDRPGSIGQADLREALARARGDRGQVDQHQPQAGRAARGGMRSGRAGRAKATALRSSRAIRRNSSIPSTRLTPRALTAS
jgi:hypothetical protein